jgi:hypothetical protein
MANSPLTLPAGTYYVGDLCYVLGDRWDEVCALLDAPGVDFFGPAPTQTVFTMADGTVFACMKTMYGDGMYGTSEHTTIPVDSGTIGAVLIDAITAPNADTGAGQRVKLTECIPYRHEGVLYFGDYEVYTSYWADEEMYDEGEFEEEY